MLTQFLSSYNSDNQDNKFVDLSAIGKIEKWPFFLRVLLENVIADSVIDIDIENFSPSNITLSPSHIIYHDFSCLPVLIDLAYMRENAKTFECDPKSIEPSCQISIVMDYLIDNVKNFTDKHIDIECPFHLPFKNCPLINSEILTYNQKLELERNKEKLSFLQWAANSFNNVRVYPPSAAALHPFTVENICSLLSKKNDLKRIATILSNDPQILRLNALGILAFEAGPLELESVILGNRIELKISRVVGCNIFGQIHPYVSSTDIVLAIIKTLKKHKLSDAVVEFFGPAVDELSMTERMCISGMSGEYSSIGYFPVDEKTIDYLEKMGCEEICSIKDFAKYSSSFRNRNNNYPTYQEVFDVDLSLLLPHCSSLNSPKNRIPIEKLNEEFTEYLKNFRECKSLGKTNDETGDCGNKWMRDGLINSAVVSSCTNPTNSIVMLAAGLLAKKAVEQGLELQKFTQATFQPGPGLALHYLLRTGFHDELNKLGFKMIGPNCSNCSDLLHNCQKDNNISPDLLRINLYSSLPSTQSKCDCKLGISESSKCVDMQDTEYTNEATCIMSPIYVVLFSIAANIDFNLNSRLSGMFDSVKVSDIWPSRKEVENLEVLCVLPTVRAEVQDRLLAANKWNIEGEVTDIFSWNSSSNQIVQPDFLKDFNKKEHGLIDICNARVLVVLGDNVGTEHISPAGCIARTTPAGKYLLDKGLAPREFDSFGSRRGNWQVMTRGTLSHTNLQNLILSRPGPKTIFFPTSTVMDIYDATMKYKLHNIELIILAGKNFGCGADREWAARGLYHLGVKVIIAESYEEIYRRNLIACGLLPLVFIPPLPKLTGRESLTVRLTDVVIQPKKEIVIETSNNGSFKTYLNCLNQIECEHITNGGIVLSAFRNIINQNKTSGFVH